MHLIKTQYSHLIEELNEEHKESSDQADLNVKSPFKRVE